MPSLLEAQSRQYQSVARAIDFIRAHAKRQPELGEIASHLGFSEHHFQRLFSEWAGISPKRFLQYVTKEYAREALRRSGDILSVAADAGLSGPGRLHDLMVSCEAMSPGEIKALGAGLEIRYGTAPTPFGLAQIAWTARGICHLGFFDADGTPCAVACLRQEWPNATFLPDDSSALSHAATIFESNASARRLHLMLRGTNFQIKVWEALLSVPAGEVVSYSQLAARTGTPKACRSVGSAIGANCIALLIPCHRVIREGGEIGSYRWGSERKAAMIAREAAQVEM